MISKDDFFKKYKISENEFNNTKLNWDVLTEIYNDYDKRKEEFEPTAKDIVERLLQVSKVHSVRYRIKDSEHLIEKIIRKKIENKRRTFTLENYITKIDDIIGIRALHLFKDDWENIDQYVKSTWKTREKPTANIRNGDSEELIKKFEERNFKIKIHKYGYRSVHYILESSPTKKTYKAELQVRTIFEEAWSEIDHTIRYPYDLENPILKQYLLMFNRLAGSADEMGTYIKFLQSELELKERKHTEKIAEREELIEELKSKIEKLKIKKETKIEIGTSLDTLMSSGIDWEKYKNPFSTGIHSFGNDSEDYDLGYQSGVITSGLDKYVKIDDWQTKIPDDYVNPNLGTQAFISPSGTPSFCSECGALFYNDGTVFQTKCNKCQDQ